MGWMTVTDRFLSVTDRNLLMFGGIMMDFTNCFLFKKISFTCIKLNVKTEISFETSKLFFCDLDIFEFQPIPKADQAANFYRLLKRGIFLDFS